MVLILVMLASLVQPCSTYAAAKSCTKGVVYQNGLAGIKISINKAPYNTIFTDKKIQGSIVSVAYDYDGCGWFASARARELTGKTNVKYIWAAEYWWTKGESLGFKKISKGGKLTHKAIAVWYPSGTHKWGHVAVVEKVNGSTVTLSEGGASNSWFKSKPDLKPYGYCILRNTTQKDLEKLGKFMGYIDLGVSFQPDVAPTGLTLSSSKAKVDINGTVQLKAAYKPASTTKKGITWTSSNKKIATVDANGKVKGLKAGKVTITATCTANKKAKATCTVTVSSKVLSTSVSLSKTSLSLDCGKTATLKASVKPAKASNKKITWTSSDKKVATVDKNGKVKAIGSGTCKITATSGDGKSKAVCTVNVPLKNGVYKLKHVGTGKMMNYAWGWKEFEYKPIFLDKRDGSVEQTFRFRHISGGKYEIDIMHKEGGVMNVWTSKTVAAGQKIGSWTKTKDDTQRFYVTPVGGGKFILRSAQNKNLAVAPDGSSRGYLQLVKYNANDKNQQWSFEFVK